MRPDQFPIQDANDKRWPPRRRDGPIPPGQSYVELFEKHGRPHGAFDKERQLPYDATGSVIRGKLPLPQSNWPDSTTTPPSEVP